jgi:hypothetical protein
MQKSLGRHNRRSSIQSFLNLITPSITNTYYGSFNGSTQSLSSPASAATTIGSGDVTFEAYIYPTSFAASACPIFVQGGTGGFWVGKNASNFVLRAYGVSDQLQYATLPDLNKWTHIAIVRSGGTVTLYYNGNAVASATSLYNFTNFTNYIGSDGLTSYFSGRISNLRLVKGSALYTANFTPPAAPLTAVSGTALLTLQDATIKDNSTNAFTITNNGSVATTSIPVTSLPPYTLYTATYLVVAGGGSGGSASGSTAGGSNGGGGGAGGLLTGTSNLTTGTTYSIVVGAGAAGVTSNLKGNNGSNSTVFGLTAIGGGGGGNYNAGALNGGSGGGGGGNSGGTKGLGTAGQGNNGGIGKNFSLGAGSGGGGGAGAVGGDSGANDPGPSGSGGNGLQSNITGTLTYYAGGGGGAAYFAGGDLPGSGGLGGGGNGATTLVVAGNGGTNTGGGGGGATGGILSSGAGGSGVVIISVPTANYTGTTTGSPTVTTSGANTVMTFTSSGSYTA